MDRYTEKLKRLDYRRTPGYMGQGPDADEPLDGTEHADKLAGFSDSGFSFTAEGGFWKDSEDRACRMGYDFPRGSLDPEHFRQGNWKKAKEAMS